MPEKICPQCGTEYELAQLFCSRDGAVLTALIETTSLIGKLIAGRYQIVRQLGEGGMGQVFLAEHIRMGRKCALKVMRPQLSTDPDAISRFNREATNASRIEHPNVASVFDFGDAENGLIYLAMEYVDGDSLAEHLPDGTSLAPSLTISIVKQLAGALQAAHELGITHRDLKPQNVMLRRTRDGDFVVKLVDFGISKVGTERRQEVTPSGEVIGTPAYMSPEQISAMPLDGRSDVYSLGLLAFKMLTGALPFPEDASIQGLFLRLTRSPMRLCDVGRRVSWGDDVEAVIARVLASHREDRYASAPEFARDLERALVASPVYGAEERSGAQSLDSTATRPAHDRRVARRRARSALLTSGVVLVAAGSSLAIRRAWRDHSADAPAAETRKVSSIVSGGALAAPVRPSSGAPTTRPPATAATFTSSGDSLVPRRRLRIGVAGLAPAARQQVEFAVRSTPGVLLVDGAADTTDLVVRADGAGMVAVQDGAGQSRVEHVAIGAIAGALRPLVRHDAATLDLASLGATASDIKLSLQFGGASSQFAVGDEIAFRIRSDVGGFLTLLDLSPDGVVTILHPSSVIDVGRVSPNQQLALPGNSAVDFRATLPTGSGVVRAIITDRPLVTKRRDRLVTSLDDPEMIASLRRTLNSRVRSGSRQWATSSIPYSIVR